MRLVFQNKKCVELLVRVILNNHNIVIKEVNIQGNIDNIVYKSIVIDVIAEDENNNIIGIEIQRDSKEAHPKRARYDSSMLDTVILEKGKSAIELPSTYVIFITENDVIGRKLYTIDRVVK